MSEPGPAQRINGDAPAVLAAEACIFRVGWVYGRRGKNFLSTIQRLAEATSEAVGQWLAARRTGHAAPARGVYHTVSERSNAATPERLKSGHGG